MTTVTESHLERGNEAISMAAMFLNVTCDRLGTDIM